MHAGLQLSHEYIPVLECNKGFVKGLIWIKESEDEPAKPKMLIHGSVSYTHLTLPTTEAV